MIKSVCFIEDYDDFGDLRGVCFSIFIVELDQVFPPLLPRVVFLWIFWNFRAPFFTEHLWWLLLPIQDCSAATKHGTTRISSSKRRKMGRLVNPFVPNAPFLYPLKTSENRKVYCYFQGVEKGCIGNEWVNKNK